MKQTHSLIIILFVLLIVIGWGAAVIDLVGGESEEYLNHIALAEDYYARGLYQKAATEYESALKLEDSEEIWQKLLDAYQARYEEDLEIYEYYLPAAESAVLYYPENIDFLLTLAHLHLDEDAYIAAYKCLNTAIENGLEDERVTNLKMQVAYSYDILWGEYTAYETCVNGYYAVKRYGAWDYMSEDGSEEGLSGLVYAGPVGQDNVRVCTNKDRTILTDTDKIVQGIVHTTIEKAGVYSEGLVPVMVENKYAYYDLLGDKKFGSYDFAGTFVDGKAAVAVGQKWYIIDTEGNQVSSVTYEQIVINLDGTYCKNDIMIAKEKGKYYMYDMEGNKVGSFVADDVDVVTEDGYVAFCKNGKWGFADLNGEEVIKPTYEGAKSFSNGLAAVYNGDKWGFINEDELLVIAYRFIDADYFNAEGKCMVCTEEREVVIEEEETEEEETEAAETETDTTGLSESGDIVLEDTQQNLPTEIEQVWQLLSRHVPNGK